MTIEKRLGKIIRDKRLEQGMSQEELAHNASLHRTYISQIERGLKSPSIKSLVKISKALCVPLNELIQDLT